MPFLRAALLKKKAIHKQEEEISSLPSAVVVAAEPEPEELPVIDNLLKVMDEKAELEEKANENEIAELGEGSSDDAAEPEVVSGAGEDIYVPESDSDSYIVQEVQEEAQEQQQEEIEPEPEPEEPEPELQVEIEPEEQEQEIQSQTEGPETKQEPEPEPEDIEQKTEEPTEIEETQEEPEEPEATSDTEEEQEQTTDEQTETKPGTDEAEEPKQEEEFKLKYDFTSGERYVDSVSTKTEFDRMLDELSAISGDLLSHEVEKFAVKFTGKFQGDFDKAESDAKKYEAFLGGYITNAAMILYDNGYREAAIKQLEQAKTILEARKKLEDENTAIKTRVEEANDTVDLSDILGLFGD